MCQQNLKKKKKKKKKKKSIYGHLTEQQQQQPMYSASADEANGKINIHVSVVFVKSLADLKKQRAQSRNALHQQSSQQQLADSNGHGVNMNATSSNDDFRRFTGNTSEIIGDTSSDRSCCCIM